MTLRPHNSCAQPFAASLSRSPIVYSAQLMAELWRVAGKRACCRALMSLVVNRRLGPTEPGCSQHACSSILTHLNNNPKCFPGFKMIGVGVDESESEAQAQVPSLRHPFSRRACREAEGSRGYALAVSAPPRCRVVY